MNDWRIRPGYRHDAITVRVIWVAFALSLLVHVATLWMSPTPMRALTLDPAARAEPAAALVAQLAPRSVPRESVPPAAPPSPPPQASPPPRQRAMKPPPAAAAPIPPPPVARSEPAPRSTPAPPAPVAEAPSAATPPVETDLSAFIAARRQARGEPTTAGAQGRVPDTPPAESEKERLNRIVTANLGLNKVPTFGDDPKRGGGMFQLRRLGAEDADFYFNGWNEDIGRVARQLIEVRRGTNADIRLAVVRKIIEIIRAQQPGDFIWVSRRLGRQVALSARPGDNAALEDFIMRDFFGDGRSP
jgi:hypothetical protein